MPAMTNPLRERRHAAGLTQTELAQKSCICVHTIYNVEHGYTYPYRPTQKKLLKGLGLSYADRDEVFPK